MRAGGSSTEGANSFARGSLKEREEEEEDKEGGRKGWMDGERSAVERSIYGGNRWTGL